MGEGFWVGEELGEELGEEGSKGDRWTNIKMINSNAFLTVIV
jgi:hypothetical protein